MQLSDFPSKPGEWLLGTGPESDIVLSSRVRIARNVAGRPFISRSDPEMRSATEAIVREAIQASQIVENLLYMDLEETEEIDRLFLVERRLISKEHAQAQGGRSVAFEPSEATSIMVNEEDHLRLQVYRSGLEIQKAWERASLIDDQLENNLEYAFHPQYGYLTSCPTNAGTGMRVSIMLHLPALVLSKQIDKVFAAVSKVHLAVRGLYGEGTRATGHIYQISNQFTMGRSEEQILETLGRFVPQILEYERRLRQALLEENFGQLENHSWRAYGLLQSARLVSSEETLDLLSAVRLGVHLGLIPDINLQTLNELFLLTQPAHLQKMAGRLLEPADRDTARAEFIREKLSADSDQPPPSPA